nr:transglutaminase family protein [Desulfobotulus pelophilus]
METPPEDADLTSTVYIDSDNVDLIAFCSRHAISGNPVQTAVALYHAVRDGILYDPYRIVFSIHGMKASTTLHNGYGYCVAKAILLTAAARAAGIPARLGFANVRNHLATPRLQEIMGTDLFVYHGYTALFLRGRWVKATPTFNRELCERFAVLPLDFDGKTDSLLHPFDAHGKQHMVYEKDHGLFQDLPIKLILQASMDAYPEMMKGLQQGGTGGRFQEETGAFCTVTRDDS